MSQQTYRAARSAAAVLLTIAMASPAASQVAEVDFKTNWSWVQVKAAPGVSAAEAEWLEKNVPEAEARELFGIIAELSRPEAAQVIPAFMDIDAFAHYRTLAGWAYLDSLSHRPPSGTGGAVRVAYLAARSRAADLAHRRVRGTYRAEFGGSSFKLPATPERPHPRGVAIRVAFDPAPAETILAILSQKDVPARSIIPRISTRPFDLLIHHHSQPFYRMPLSREQLALNLAQASSTDPLAKLYRYANPRGLYHYTDVVTHLNEYKTVLSTLKQNEQSIAAHLHERLAPFLPPGTKVDRTIAYFFADLSDGWAVDNYAAVTLEYYKDDYERLIETMVHELFHVAQAAVTKRPVAAGRAPLDSAVADVLDNVLVEGTAYYIAPGVRRTPEETAAAVKQGAALLESVIAFTEVDAPKLQEVVNKGVAGGGPFYTMGGAMSEVIVRAFGEQGLAETLESDGVDFFKTYVRAAQRLRVPNIFSDAVTHRIMSIKS